MPYVSLGAAGLACELQRLPQVVPPSLAVRSAHAFNFDFDCKCKHAHAHAHAHTPPPRHTCTTTDGKSRMVQAHTCANTLELPNYWAALRAAAGDFLPRETFP